MCYYATTDYLCGDWKWGNMMLRCPRQHRIGETCGAKLVHHESVTKSQSICKICEEMNTKQRRLIKTRDNISRWSREPDKFSASLEKARGEAKDLEGKIYDLNSRRPSIATNISATMGASNGRTAAAATPNAAPTLPPVASMDAQAPSGYEYTSVAGRRQENGPYSVPRNGMTPVGGMSLAPGQTDRQYVMPTASYTSRSTTAVNGSSVHLPVDRQSGTYRVSYARR